MWSLLELFPTDFRINILDVGAALSERPPYQSLVDAERGTIFGFEPDREACERLNLEYGDPHRFFPFFVGDGQPAIFHETNWALTGSLYAPNSRLLEKFQNLAEVVTPIAEHAVNTMRLDDIPEIGDIDFIKDALYVRDWMRLEGLSETNLRNYAILAHDVLRSYDLAHFVL